MIKPFGYWVCYSLLYSLDSALIFIGELTDQIQVDAVFVIRRRRLVFGILDGDLSSYGKSVRVSTAEYC